MTAPSAPLAPKGNAAPSSLFSCLMVRAGTTLCALPLAAVRRVVRALPVHALPGAAPELLGLAEFSGEPLPVLDLARLVSASPSTEPALPVTVVVWAGPEAGRELVGLQADDALEVVTLDGESLVPGGRGVVASEGSLRGIAVRVLDLSALGAP